MLPLRVGVRTASLALQGTEAVLTRALALTGRPVTADPPAPPPKPPAERSSTTTAEPSPAAAPKPSPAAAPKPSPAAEPIHVSEEPELVREVAEPGAEDGAGAQVTVDEPWEGYAKLNAKDVLARLGVASQAELAAVTLYESVHRARETVLSEVERLLALAARDEHPSN